MVYLDSLEHWQQQSLPRWEEIAADFHVLALPMRVKFRGLMTREVALFRGPAGWGEFSPFTEYEADEAASWLLAGLEAAWLGFPPAQRDWIPVNATLPAVAAKEVAGVLGAYGEIREIKVKVAEKGQNLDDDLARLRAARDFAPQARLKVDANMGWNQAQALEALEAFEDFDLLYAEQPVAGIEGLARLREEARRRGLSTPIAADEAVRKAQDPLAVARLGAADLLVIKAAPLGGVRSALNLAQQAKLPIVVSSALDSSVGISMGLALAASLPSLPYGCGLGTLTLMREDVASHPLPSNGAALAPGQVEPSREQLTRLAVSPDRYRWWLNRTRTCYQQLTQALGQEEKRG